MIFLGTTLLGGIQTATPTATDVSNINFFRLENGYYDALYVSKETTSIPTDTLPDEWDFDTIFYAHFDDSLGAGNVDWDTNTVTHVIVKRRKSDEFKWYTINAKPIYTPEDFNNQISGIDFTNASGADYEYALVPVFQGIEGVYNATSVHSEFDKVFICEKEKIVGTDITDGFCDTVRNNPSSFVEIMHGRYPVAIDTTIANYDTGNFTGTFVEVNDCNNIFDKDDYSRITFEKETVDFLTNRKPKLLKHFDGRIWLIRVNPNVNYTAQDYYKLRQTLFDWTEIGDYKSEEDLYYTNLSDVTEEWWNQ